MMKKSKFSTRLLTMLLAVVMVISIMPMSAFAAPASDLPANMVDHSILRALEYTGYDVQQQKNDGTLYQSGSYGSRTPTSVLSDISYGTSTSGQETVADSSTPTGKAPNIALFEQKGLCCAAFVSYYVMNYLPNIEGADTQFISDAIHATGMNSQACVTWQTALNKLANEGKLEKIGTSSSNVDRSKLTPGDLIIFGTSENSHTHIAVYSGTYKGVDYIIHVGNDRGPEISRVDWMGQAGDKSSYPNAYFHLPQEIFESDGDIEVYKKDTDGKNLAGAVFVATNSETGKSYKIGPTNSSGYAKTENPVPYGTYTVKETVFPTNYHAYGKTEWTVTVDANNDGLATINAVNEADPGSAKIVKTSEDGVVEGVTFTLSGNGVNKTVTTDVNGTVQIDDLKPGTYQVKETMADKYEPQETRNVVVVSNQVATVTFNNVLKRGDLQVVKDSEDGLVEGVKFHLYGTSLSGLRVDEYAVTDKNGVATFNDVLISGHESYTLEEVDTAERYIVPESQRAAIEWNTVTEKYFYNELKRGDLTVKKTSEDGFVEGMCFRLTGTSLSGIKVDEYAYTDSKGVAYFEDILIGTGYTIEEVNTPIRYVIPDRQTADIAWDELTEIEFENILKKWRADVFKLDAELAGESGGGLVPVEMMPMALSLTSDETVEELGSPYGDSQGDATLAGAVYGVFKGEVLIDSYTTDENGYFLTKYYPCDYDWTIREISPSEGYMLDPTVYYMDVAPDYYSIELNTIYPDVYEEIIKGDIAIIKHTDDGSTQIETPEVGAKFEIFLKSAGSYENAKETERDIIVCDEHGFGQTQMLPYGVYTVHQVIGWEGRELMEDFDVTISEHEMTYRFLINNRNFEAFIRVVKTDSTTGKVIPYAGAAFQLYDPDGNLISMSYTYPELTTIDTFYTTEDGTLLTPEKLPYGKGYSLVEVFAPYGYVLDSTPIYFDVTENNSNDEDGLTVIKVDKKNEPQMGTITIDKKGEVFSTVTEKDGIYTPVYEVKGLEGAVFGVYAVEDIYTLDGTLRYAAGEKVATITTSADGTATTEPLFLGKFELREEKAPYGMVLLEEPIQVELVYAGQEVKITTTVASAVNERQKVVISLLKQLEKDDTYGIGLGSEYENIKFGLYAAEAMKAADGTEIPKDGLLEIVGIDANGTAVFTVDLPAGAKLYVKEYATDSHYQLSDTAFPVEFIYEDSTVATVQIVVNNGEIIDNAIIRGSLEGLKVDEENNPVEKVQFGLFKADETEFTAENALVIVESDADGKFSITGIPFGKWILKELSCPAHLVMNTDTFEVNITEQGQVVTYTIVNEIVTGSVEGIKTDDEGKPVAGVVIGLFADGTTEFTVENAIATVETGEDGVFKFENLKYGKWLIKELSCSDKFIMCEDVFEAVIDKDGAVISIIVVNINITGSVRVVKINSKDHEQKLSGTVFHIYLDVNGNGAYDPDIDTYFDKLLEVETGIYELSGLKYNGYFIFEEQAPDGFTKDDRYFYFQIKADNEVVIVENEIGVGFTNEPIPEPEPEYPDSPQTGDNSNLGLWFGLAIGSLSLLILTLILGKKKRKVN
ncbi:MAG: LPXTG cell wall anchor domain-containing protein [Bacteroidaceae bacterium]|nr:LPXTG cell wall anchor domain-containing protein [Bacteroidaceae bacterium]